MSNMAQSFALAKSYFDSVEPGDARFNSCRKILELIESDLFMGPRYEGGLSGCGRAAVRFPASAVAWCRAHRPS